MTSSASPTLIFNYDISCPFAYIASTRIQSLAARSNATLIYRPVLLGAIYRSTAAPQGANGSASDVFNPTKKTVASASMARTLKRYQIKYNPPARHPMKTVNALRLLYCVHGAEREKLTDALFKGYWVTGRDVTSTCTLLGIAEECGIGHLDESCFLDLEPRRALEQATQEAIEHGAFGVPGFWIPGAGRFFWGQDRMHFVEATLLSLSMGEGKGKGKGKGKEADWSHVPNLSSLLPRCIPLPTSPSPSPSPPLSSPTTLEFWFDFSSPWAFLAYTQLARLQRQHPGLEITLKPFLLGILFREIGAPNMPMLAVSRQKAAWAQRDHADWTAWWNAVNAQQGNQDKGIEFQWAHVFPIRTPTVLRVSIVEPKTVSILYSACWEQNQNVSDENVLRHVLTNAGFDGADLIAKANAPEIKAKLRELTAEAKDLGICGVPTYRVLRGDGAGAWKNVGGLVWGQDETNVVEDLIAGWDPESSREVAEPRKSSTADTGRNHAKL